MPKNTNKWRLWLSVCFLGFVVEATVLTALGQPILTAIVIGLASSLLGLFGGGRAYSRQYARIHRGRNDAAHASQKNDAAQGDGRTARHFAPSNSVEWAIPGGLAVAGLYLQFAQFNDAQHGVLLLVRLIGVGAFIYLLAKSWAIRKLRR